MRTIGDPSLNAIVFGLADFGKPRTRLLIESLRAHASPRLITRNVWAGVEDKSQVRSVWARARLLLSAALAYPALLARFLVARRADVVFVPYFGLFDVIFLKPFALLRRTPIVWDAFLSVYDTVVDDRGLVRRGGASARLLKALEALACRLADVILVDTDAHGRYFEARYPGAAGKTRTVLVGAEMDFFRPNEPMRAPAQGRSHEVLFYGQCIPLHGIETILEAARLAWDERSIRWTIIGDGQEAARIESFVAAHPDVNLVWERWVPYAELPARIAAADLCLGIFGAGDKAARVIPNKVFQYTAMGKPIVTRDSDAIRELFSPDDPGVHLVEAGRPEALLAAVREALAEAANTPANLHAAARARIGPTAIGDEFMKVLAAAV